MNKFLLKVRSVAVVTARDLSAKVAANRIVVALMAALFVSLLPVAAHAQTFSIDTSSLMTSAANIFNGLWPAFAIVAGLSLGLALVKFIVQAIRTAF